jgi:hypothetical protein
VPQLWINPENVFYFKTRSHTKYWLNHWDRGFKTRSGHGRVLPPVGADWVLKADDRSPHFAYLDDCIRTTNTKSPALAFRTQRTEALWCADPPSKEWQQMSTRFAVAALTIQVPGVGNFESYKDFYNWQDVTSFSILAEIHRRERFGGNFSSTLEDLKEFLFIISLWKMNSFDNLKLKLGTLWIKDGVSSESKKHNVPNPRQLKKKDNFTRQYWFFINFPSSPLELLTTGVLKLRDGTNPNYTHIYMTPPAMQVSDYFFSWREI